MNTEKDMRSMFPAADNQLRRCIVCRAEYTHLRTYISSKSEVNTLPVNCAIITMLDSYASWLLLYLVIVTSKCNNYNVSLYKATFRRKNNLV